MRPKILAGLVRLLHPDRRVRHRRRWEGLRGSQATIYGGQRVAEVMVRVGLRWRRPDRIEAIEIGGEPALVYRRDGSVYSVDTVQLTEGLIKRVSTGHQSGQAEPPAGRFRSGHTKGCCLVSLMRPSRREAPTPLRT